MVVPQPVPGPAPDDVPARIRHLGGSHNVRDLGGLTGLGGAPVRAGRIFRGDYPTFARTEGGALVRELGLRRVVDLRRKAEADFETEAWDELGVEYERCPLSSTGGESSWDARYPAYLTNRPEVVVAAVRSVIDVSGHPVLFHCAAGKDRTGVVAALVLEALGVPREAVVNDYLLTGRALPHVLAELRGRAPYAAMLEEHSDADLLPRADTMHGFLRWLDDRGGAAVWLMAQGVSRVELTDLRREMLETEGHHPLV